MNCPNCSFPNQPGRKFCGNCGAALPSSPAASEPQSSTTSNQEPTASRHPPTPYDSPLGIESASIERRGRTPLLIAVGSLALLGVLLLMATLAWSGRLWGGVGSGATPTPVVVDPVAVLERARKATGDVKTVKYRSEAGFFGIDGSGSLLTSTTPLTVSIQGEMELPGNYTLDSNIPQLGDYVGIGDTTWSRQNNDSGWTRQETGSLSLGLINPLTLFNYLQYYQVGTPTHIDSEQRDNVTLHRIRFQVDTGRMSLDTNDRSLRNILAASRVDIDAWIDDRGYLLDSMALAVESEDGAGVLVRTYFSDYNGPVDIKPPGSQ